MPRWMIAEIRDVTHEFFFLSRPAGSIRTSSNMAAHLSELIVCQQACCRHRPQAGCADTCPPLWTLLPPQTQPSSSVVRGQERYTRVDAGGIHALHGLA